ncbi:hypothetical protein H9S92_02410 [Lewinella lacunae]|uniref:Uncharacterized protein n=1 Tax=Neolewinella lacunae TaxID=1517758 RepID=A0A923PHW7_9BACT|nr:hypothetical protein [Neolewinella lacunae]MBC6993006.1 hypothetical protein [Neolewinella lacunae]
MNRILAAAGNISEVESVRQEWSSVKANLSNNLASAIVDGTIELAISSTTYWNEKNGFDSTAKISPQAAADVGGFVIGAGIAAVNAHNNGGIQGEDVNGIIMGGLGGALAGSLGAAGKVGRWLSSLF